MSFGSASSVVSDASMAFTPARATAAMSAPFTAAGACIGTAGAPAVLVDGGYGLALNGADGLADDAAGGEVSRAQAASSTIARLRPVNTRARDGGHPYRTTLHCWDW